MTNRERMLAALRYESYDRLPLVNFGYWRETLCKWAAEGHISDACAQEWADGNAADRQIAQALGFDLNWNSVFAPVTYLDPEFPPQVVDVKADGSRAVVNKDGVVVLEKPGVTSIPMEFDHLLKTRTEWERYFLHRLKFSPDRVNRALVHTPDGPTRWDNGGRAFLRDSQRGCFYGLFCGSLIGHIRNTAGVQGLTYIYADDEPLFDEMVNTVGELCYQCARYVLKSGARFDFALFWEDICFRSGPLVSPQVFAEKAGPHYRRITQLCADHGVDIVAVDSDGCIDALVPIWLEHGVNTMFPIEVGAWGASIAPWREQYGKALRGVGGMNKNVFAADRGAIDAEIERLKPLVELGGYIPCPDHRIAPDAEWENVRYYTSRMRETFG